MTGWKWVGRHTFNHTFFSILTSKASMTTLSWRGMSTTSLFKQGVSSTTLAWIGIKIWRRMDTGLMPPLNSNVAWVTKIQITNSGNMFSIKKNSKTNLNKNLRRKGNCDTSIISNTMIRGTGVVLSAVKSIWSVKMCTENIWEKWIWRLLNPWSKLRRELQSIKPKEDRNKVSIHLPYMTRESNRIMKTTKTITCPNTIHFTKIARLYTTNVTKSTRKDQYTPCTLIVSKKKVAK